MKKFLSLVLALVMAMSLVTISAGAKDFTDASDIEYVDAIEVMSELDVIDGYTDGSFRPTAELNRGAAAKIICNMILGPTTASALSASSAPFSDVPADSVFAGYITYCSKEGIINGYTDGTFRPTAPLTGYAFMKMLLGALGYDAEVEGYTGANWSVNVAKQAIGIGLDDGNDEFVGTKYVTREEACLYALNTLKATMVKYGQKTTVTVNGAQVVVGGSEASEVGATAKEDKFKEDEKLQFAEKYFTKLTTTGTFDDYGRPASKWMIKNKTVGVYADDADVSYTEEVKGKAIYADLGSDVESKATMTIYRNGKDVTSDKDYADFQVYKKNDEKVGAQGTLTEVYFDSDKGANGDVRIVMVDTFVLQVNGDYDEDDEVLELVELDVKDLEELPEGVETTLKADDFEGLENFADEDIVLVTVAANDEGQYIDTIALAEKVTAVIDEHVLDESVTADGSEYKFAWAWTEVDKTENYEVDEEYDLYLDFYGNIIYSEGVEADDVYAFVIEYAPTSFMNKNSKVDAYTYFVDGSEDEIRVAKVNTKKVKALHIDDEAHPDLKFLLSSKENNWVTYTEDEGVYNLVIKSQVETSENGYTGPITAEDSIKIFYDTEKYARGTKNTEFIVVDADGDVEVYTGIKNAPELTAKNSMIYIVVDDNNYAEYVFVSLADGESDGTEDSKDVIYFIKPEKEGTDAADNDYYRFKGIVNGEEGKVRTDVDVDGVAFKDEEGNSLLEIGLYTEIEYDAETGYVTEAVLITAENAGDDYVVIDAGKAEISQKNGVITFNELSKVENDGEDQIKVYMTDDAEIMIIDEDGDVKTVSAKKLASNYSEWATLKVVGVLNDDAECTALYIYAVEK